MTQAPAMDNSARVSDVGSAELDALPDVENYSGRNESFDDYVDTMQDNSMKFDDMPEELRETAPESNAPKSSVREDNWTPKRSFLAESPYFSAFVEKEMHEIGTVTDILNDISTRTRKFTKYGSLMAEATHSLSLSCRLRREEASQEEPKYSPRAMDRELEKRRQALGPEMSDLLGILGEVS